MPSLDLLTVGFPVVTLRPVRFIWSICTIRAFIDWYPTPPFFYGWLVIATAFLGALVATTVAQNVLGGVQDFIASDMNWDRKTIALFATSGTWISGLTMPFVGKLADRYDPRYIMSTAALSVAIGLIILSHVSSAWAFLAVYIIVRSIAGPNLQNVVPRTVAVNFFQRRRNLALGITAQNRIIGEAINIQLIGFIASRVDWRLAYKVLGFAWLPLIVPLLVFMRRRPEDVGQFPDGDTENLVHNGDKDGLSCPTSGNTLGYRDALRMRAFWYIVMAEFLTVTMTGAIMFQIVPLLYDAGLPHAVAVGALTTSVFAGGLLLPLWGYISDKFSVKLLAGSALLLTCFSTTAFLVLDTLGYGHFIAVIFGIFSGGLPVIGSMMLGKYFGRGSFGVLTGLTGPFRTAAMGLGPTLGALLLGFSGGYAMVFQVAIVAYVLSIILNFSVRTPKGIIVY